MGAARTTEVALAFMIVAGKTITTGDKKQDSSTAALQSKCVIFATYLITKLFDLRLRDGLAFHQRRDPLVQTIARNIAHVITSCTQNKQENITNMHNL